MDSALRRIRIAVSTGRLRGLPAEPGTPEITLLGAGESYVAWRIGSGDQAQVLRVPRRSPHEMPRSMMAEFETLRRVPPELGTSAIALETGTDNPLGIPYMVTTHVSGRALRATDWNPRGSRPPSPTRSPACTRPLLPVPHRRPCLCRVPASRGRSC